MPGNRKDIEMKNRKIIQMSLVTALTFVFACLLLPYAASQTTQDPTQTAQKLSHGSQEQSQNLDQTTLSQTAQAGHYSITLKITLAETFNGPEPEMIRDGGAQPNEVDGPNPPNNHLAAFITEDGKPVLDANVEISYRSALLKDGEWTMLPVVRMHSAGKGLETTHFGNNVTVPTNGYDVRVTVNGTGPITFHFIR
jgi:hypothetical protein